MSTPITFYIRTRIAVTTLTTIFTTSIAFTFANTTVAIVLLVLGSFAVALSIRTRLRIDERNVHFRSAWPGASWSRPWPALLGVSTDRVRTSAGGGGASAASYGHRLQFMVQDSPPEQAIGFSRRTCVDVLDIFRERGLDALDINAT